MKKNSTGFVALAAFILLLAACKTSPTSDLNPQTTGQAVQTVLPPLPPEARSHIIGKCITLCQDALAAGKNLAKGPCLSDGMSFEPDWVCDVAHYPRQPIDDQPENQCADFRSGKANHFVEVNENCNLIKRH